MSVVVPAVVAFALALALSFKLYKSLGSSLSTKLVPSAGSESKKQMSAADAYGAQMVKKRISMYAKGAAAPSFNKDPRGRAASKEVDGRTSPL